VKSSCPTCCAELKWPSDCPYSCDTNCARLLVPHSRQRQSRRLRHKTPWTTAVSCTNASSSSRCESRPRAGAAAVRSSARSSRARSDRSHPDCVAREYRARVGEGDRASRVGVACVHVRRAQEQHAPRRHSSTWRVWCATGAAAERAVQLLLVRPQLRRPTSAMWQGSLWRVGRRTSPRWLSSSSSSSSSSGWLPHPPRP